MNSPMVIEAVAFAKRFPTFAAHVEFFSSGDSLVLKKHVFATKVFSTFSRVIMSFPPVKGSSTFSSLVWLLPGVCGLPTGKGLPWHKKFAVFHKWGSVHVASEAFLSNVLLLVLKFCTEIQLLLPCPSIIQFLPLMFSQVQNVSQVRAAYLTKMGLLGGHTCLESTDLWPSMYRNALFRRCLFMLCSMPTTWKQVMLVKCTLTLVGGDSYYKSVCNKPRNLSMGLFAEARSWFQLRMVLLSTTEL